MQHPNAPWADRALFGIPTFRGREEVRANESRYDRAGGVDSPPVWNFEIV
jgi:hypothetical protein